MECVLIAAVARNGTLGWRGKLPWNLPEETKHFRERIRGEVVIMGRKTYQSVTALREVREVGVLTRRQACCIKGAKVFTSVQEVLHSYPSGFCVLGGGEVYRLFLPYATVLELSFIQRNYPGDCFFPLEILKSWREITCSTVRFFGGRVKYTQWVRKEDKLNV